MYEEYIKELNEIDLTEQAVARKDAVSKCIDLGTEFIEHFEKIYKDRKGIDSIDFYHHCSEMMGWWKTVRKLKLTHNNKPLNDSKLVDWFFTAGSDVKILFEDEKERIVYCKLMNELLANKDSLISDILEKLLQEELAF